MILFRSIEEIPADLPPVVATIGNFDGVHLGHRQIFRQVKDSARQIGGASAVITFIPHPLKVVPSGKELHLINTYAEKETLIAASGIDYLIVLPFTKEFAALSAAAFVKDVLAGRLGVRKLIIGYDYAFGRNREGNTDLLKRLGEEYGFSVDVLAPIGDGSLVYSSSGVRRLITDGNVSGVVPFLGRHYSLAGRVVHGRHRGTGLGFPTANLETEKELIPRAGVYAVKVKIDDVLYNGACNIGLKPTFSEEVSSVEIFLFDFSGDLYGRELRVYFIERIRDEKKFADVALLQRAIGEDVARCRELLRDAQVIEYHEYLGEEEA